MDGVHDLGGIEGFGPVPVMNGDAHFRDISDWEKRVWGMSRERSALLPDATIDWFRHGIERMVPSDYLGFAYFSKWCVNYLALMVDGKLITLDDVKRGHLEKTYTPAAAISLEDALDSNSKADFTFEVAATTEPGFFVGQTVRTHRHISSRHTRLPRYARDKCGIIIAHHGCHLLPDEGAKGNHVGGHLYTVAFAATELWGPGVDQRDSVTLELWEDYLVQA